MDANHHYDRTLTQTLPIVQIRAADAAGVDDDLDVTVRRGWLGDVAELDAAFAFGDFTDGFHGRSKVKVKSLYRRERKGISGENQALRYQRDCGVQPGNGACGSSLGR